MEKLTSFMAADHATIPAARQGENNHLSRDATLRALLVGGPMYDGLYARIPEFEAQTGLRVEVLARLPHPELNARVARDFGAGSADVDLLSTHTKYAPSQAQWLSPIEDLIPAEDQKDLLPRPAELARIGGALVQYPRSLDCRLLYYRRDLFEDEANRREFEQTRRRALRVPETWDELVETAIFLARPGLHGFLFPGRDSGLFGTFYELLVAAGGELFDADLKPAFASPAGYYAADRLAELHHRRRTTPEVLPRWHYDEVSAAFRRGEAAMVCDWPGSDYLYASAETSAVADRTGLALLPAGFTGRRGAYAGCHSFAVPKTTRNREGAGRLLRFLTTVESELDEARRGALPVRRRAFEAMRREAEGHLRAAHRLELLARTSEDLIIPPCFARYPACEDAIWRGLQRAMTGVLPPLEAVQEAAAAVAQVVTDQRTLLEAR
jgi:multiple sugar transport system substrate-binding protein